MEDENAFRQHRRWLGRDEAYFLDPALAGQGNLIFPKFDEEQIVANARAYQERAHKQVVTSVSVHPIPTTSDIESAKVAHIIGEADDAIRSVYAELRDHRGPILPSDVDEILKTTSGKLARTAFEQVLDHSFKPQVSPTHYKQVFNAPQIMLINEAFRRIPHGGRMLILGPRKHDFNRLKRAFESQRSKNVQVFVQTTDQIRGWNDWPSWMLPFQHTMQNLLDRQECRAEFNCIFFPYSFARLMGTMDRGELLANLRRILKPGGYIYATYIDHDSVRELSQSLSQSPDNVVTIYSESASNGNEGTFYTRIADNDAYEDYVISQEALAKYVLPGEELDILPARTYLDRSVLPGFLKLAARHEHLAMIRVVRWRVGEEMRRRRINPVENVDFNPAGYTVEALVDYKDIYNVNRGVAFSDVDLFYHHPAHSVITPKADGVEAVLWTDDPKGCVRMIKRGDPNVYDANFKLPAGITVQVELVGGEPLRPRWLVVTDVLKWPGGEVGYAARMNGLEAFLEGVTPLTFPPRVPGSFHPNLRNIIVDYPTDGFVINNRHALPGSFKTGRGAARYLKEHYTVEVVGDDGQIYEVLVKGSAPGYPKLRTDRSSPSSARDIEVAMAAWRTSDYEKRIHYLYAAPASLALTLRAAPREEAPHYCFSVAELIYLWVPWRDRSIETGIAAMYGYKAVEWFQTDLANAMIKMARANLKDEPQTEFDTPGPEFADAFAGVCPISAGALAEFGISSDKAD